MIKIYGMPTCPYCAYVDEQVKGDKRFKVIDIGENVRYMSAFMHLRDKSAAFDHSKEIGDIGIPAFVLEDGTVTLKPEDVGLKERQNAARQARKINATNRLSSTDDLRCRCPHGGNHGGQWRRDVCGLETVGGRLLCAVCSCLCGLSLE